MRDLVLEVGDDLAGLFLVVLGLLYQLPGLVDLLPQDRNGLRVLLGQLDGCLDSSGVLHDGLIQVLAPGKRLQI